MANICRGNQLEFIIESTAGRLQYGELASYYLRRLDFARYWALMTQVLLCIKLAPGY